MSYCQNYLANILTNVITTVVTVTIGIFLKFRGLQIVSHVKLHFKPRLKQWVLNQNAP